MLAKKMPLMPFTPARHFLRQIVLSFRESTVAKFVIAAPPGA
jgi:hypothetical protein